MATTGLKNFLETGCITSRGLGESDSKYNEKELLAIQSILRSIASSRETIIRKCGGLTKSNNRLRETIENMQEEANQQNAAILSKGLGIKALEREIKILEQSKASILSDLDYVSREADKYEKKIKDFNNLSFFGRVKVLFNPL